MSTNGKSDWVARWIGYPDAQLFGFQAAVLPAPHFRREFDVPSITTKVEAFFSGLGYGELWINGQKVDDRVLDPVPTHYDIRTRYTVHDITRLLVPGKNVIGVILGNGGYNCHTPEAWNFDKAPWRDYPKMLLEVIADGSLLVASDPTWKVHSGPIVFDGLRNGETYDASLELEGWLQPGYEDSDWKACAIVPGPGGILVEQTMPPCRVTRTISPTSCRTLDNGDRVFDLGENTTGWARIQVSGPTGAEIVLRYGERCGEDGSVDQSAISKFIFSPEGNFQTDRYRLKGSGLETWEPRFTYHGFQFIQVSCPQSVSLQQIEGRVVHTAFASAGSFSCSNETLTRLQDCTRRTYLNNFTGIPTDCPHREKCGWTGDAQLAVETGLLNFDTADSYRHWIDSMVDEQRPSGQLPGIVPSAGWGFNWGSGPAWDSALVLIPWQVYLHTGDRRIIETNLPAMLRYLDFCHGMATEGIVSFGLGDWCHPVQERATEVALTSTAFYYLDARLVAKMSALTGQPDQQRRNEDLARMVRKAFNRRFYQGGGIYGKGEPTSMAVALCFGLVEDAERAATEARLAEAVLACGVRSDFGILGAKYVPRALSESGNVALAYQLIIQPEFPGWAHWLTQGATTLWENWTGEHSRNHIMFGDISAWMFRYLAGIAPDEKDPGFQHILIRPHLVPGLTWVRAEHAIPSGKISSSWEICEDVFRLDIDIPPGSRATVTLPDLTVHQAGPGSHSYRSPLGF